MLWLDKTKKNSKHGVMPHFQMYECHCITSKISKYFNKKKTTTQHKYTLVESYIVLNMFIPTLESILEKVLASFICTSQDILSNAMKFIHF